MSATLTFGAAPGALPLLGHVLSIGTSPLAFMAALPEHGDLVRIRLGPWPAYVVCHPTLVHQVLVNDRVFDKGGPTYDKLREVGGNGLVTCEHRYHRRQRRLVQPAFHRDRLPGYAEMMSAQVDTVTRSWRDGQVLDVVAVMNAFSTGVATRTLFAADVDAAVLAEIQRATTVIFDGVARRLIVPFAWLEKIPTPGNRRFLRARRSLEHHTQQLITDYRRAGVDHGDLMSMLLAARDDDANGLTDEEIHEQVLTFFSAGSETVSAALPWVWHLLAHHPEAEAQLHDEVDSVLGGRTAHYEDLPKLRTTARVLTETLRLYPPVWLLTRRTSAETELAGQRLPSGTVLVFSPYILHHHPGYYPDPERFDPGRWQDEAACPRAERAFTPFGGGARKCIGEEFAKTEATLALASMAARWRLEPLPHAQVRPAPRLALAPRSLRMRLRRR
ncbi:cytochrome P450 [Streptomyces sp. MST-110588]|uniref:cytochrome P450 n=1 Tax=Streptomyces sp. MST-110588 TaxID=2833628 RepID=UPI001F5C249A|nr:cytochrome P450 [Streptomyces sp. MST-110588]UNO43367.1 cytochrome P450 [Streptomyces sp. MST-110588]